MAKTMTASQMTDGQIDSAVDQLRDAMRKHRDKITKEAAQQALGVDNLGMRMFSVFRKLSEAMNEPIIRPVLVSLRGTAQEALEATGRRQYTDTSVVDAMPKPESNTEEVHFFRLGRYVGEDDLEHEYELRGLKPVDPYTLAAINEADPAFADEHPNCTHWKDASGKWCEASFRGWIDERYVRVFQDGAGWDGRWWFAGVRR